jgi:CO/xanthine dehydrogenase Mo-binding subunit
MQWMFVTPSAHNFPYAIHVVRVEVNGTTRDVRSAPLCVSYDIGRAINPCLPTVTCGGFPPGLGGALRKELVYAESGQLLTASSMDYRLHRIVDSTCRGSVAPRGGAICAEAFRPQERR